VDRNPGPFVAKGMIYRNSVCFREVLISVEEVEVLPEFSAFIGEDWKTLRLIESHGDQVLELPEDAVRLATSQTCLNEIWCYRSALAIQPHPELSPAIMKQIVLPHLKQAR